MSKLTKDEIQNIEKYSDQIQTIEDYMKAVRMTLGQYLGYYGSKGWKNAFREWFQNGLDENADPNSPCDMVMVKFDENDQHIEVEDNGRGVPFQDQERVFCDPHTSKNYQKEKGQYSAGRHGVGAKVSNAVSSKMIVTSYILGQEKTIEFHNGLVYKEGKIKACKNNKQGTYVAAWPHPVLGEVDLKAEDILDLIETLVPLNKIGTKVVYTGVKRSGKVISRVVVNQDGLLTYLVKQTTHPLIKPIVMFGDTGEVRVEAAFTYDSTFTMPEANIVSFANYCPTTGGTHKSAFIDSICTYFRNYMNNIVLASAPADKKKRKQPPKMTVNDIKFGLNGVIHGLCLYPTFGGQAKETLTNPEMEEYLKSQVPIWLNEWVNNNPKDLAKLCKYFKDVLELRLKSDESKIKVATKYQVSAVSGMPSKYLKPNGDPNKVDFELIIVEGDSAYGSYINSRNSMCQGLYPIRGKITNVLTSSMKEVLNNEEVQGLIKIIGGGYGDHFDISKVPWKKIIIATDADMDGYHIRTLLMKLFLKLMTPMIVERRIYIAIPPLFGLILNNGKIQYFTNKIDYIRYVEKSFIKEVDVRYHNNRKIREVDLVHILYENAGYKEEMDKLAYSIDPFLLETVLLHRREPIKQLKKSIKSKHRFMDSVIKEGDSIVIQGTESQKRQTIFLNDRFLARCNKVINYIDHGMEEFIVDGQPTTLYGLMKRFDDYRPSHILRYKGLGEMNEDQLAESTLYPSSTRRLKVYTVEDLDKDVRDIRMLESNKQDLLKSVL